MKKIYTLLAAFCVVFGANAQTDFSVEWVSLTPGTTYDEASLDAQFTVTNESADTYLSGDTILISYTVNDNPRFIDNINGAGWSRVFLTEDMAPGATVGPFGFPALSFPSGITLDLCAVVYGLGDNSVTEEGFDEDVNPDDNVTCVSVDVTDGFDVGIEEAGLSLTNVYVSGNQLLMVNEGTNGEALVNLSIVNMNGQTVQTNNFVMIQGTNSVAINDLTPGIYIVAIEVNGEVSTRKISIQ